MSDNIVRWKDGLLGMLAAPDGDWVRWEEYERLRAELKELRTMDVHGDKTIERLRARIEEQHGEIGLLLKRIEELEANIFDLLDRLSAVTGEADLAFIPNDRIDKMWEYIEKLKIAGDDHCSSLAIVIKEVLALADIVECDHLKASQINGELVEPCPDCNGHGWRMKDET